MGKNGRGNGEREERGVKSIACECSNRDPLILLTAQPWKETAEKWRKIYNVLRALE